MFKIEEDNFSPLKTIKIKNTDKGECVSVAPGFGANVNKLVFRKGGASYSVLKGNHTVEDFVKGSFYTNAVLAPFPNRVKDGAYTFGGRRYQLELNHKKENHAIHGFVYDKGFRVVNTDEGPGWASVKLAYNYDGALAGYPFAFNTELIYTLDAEKGFRCRTKVENRSGHEMPLGTGWHPYFTFGKKVDSLFLKFPAKERVLVDSRLIPTGEREQYDLFDTARMIGDTKFDTCFKLRPGAAGIQKAELYDKEQNATTSLWMETGENKYNYLQIYIPADRMSIALEPMTCNADAFNNHRGLIVLKPGEKFIAEYGVNLF